MTIRSARVTAWRPPTCPTVPSGAGGKGGPQPDARDRVLLLVLLLPAAVVGAEVVRGIRPFGPVGALILRRLTFW